MKVHLNRLILGVVLALLLVFGGGLFAGSEAVEGGGIGIAPTNPDPAVPQSSGWFIYNLLPGETKTDQVTVVNTGEVAKTIKLYPVDATTTDSGSFVLREKAEKRVGVGNWVKLDKDEITLAPNRQEVVGFTIQIPKDAEVGDHIGGIVAEPTVGAAEGQINVVTRVGARIYETVPGDIVKQLELDDFRYELMGEGGNRDKVKFSFSLVNQGNVHLDPKAVLEITNSLTGGQVESLEASLGTIFPRGKTEVPVVWANTPLLGKYVARATVTYGDQAGEKIEREIQFTYVSKRAKVLAVGVMVLLVVVVVTLKGREGTKKRKKK